MITVVKWISEEESNGKECKLGGLGGVGKSMFWNEYLELFTPDCHGHMEALREAILQKGAFTGEAHQNDAEGTPLFSDGSIAAFSFRAWGDLLSAIFNTKIGEKKWDYMDFYYIYLPEDERLNYDVTVMDENLRNKSTNNSNLTEE
jgi:hypothetical protein